MFDSENIKLEALKNALKACRKAFRYSLFFSLISNLMMLALPIYSLQVLDRVISSASLETLSMLTIVVMLALICLSLVLFVRASILSKLGNWLENKISPVLFAHGIANAAQSRQVSSSQHLGDLSNIKNFMTGPAMTSLLDAPWSIIFIAFLFFVHPTIGVISILGGIVLFIIALLNEITTKKSIELASESSLKSSHYADLASRNAESVEAMGMLGNVTKIWDKHQQKYLKLHDSSNHKSSIFSSFTRFFRLGLQVGVTGIGAYYVLDNQMSVGAMIAAGILVGRALAPFESAIISWKSFISARKSLKRLKESLDNTPIRHSSLELPEPKGHISVKELFYVPAGMRKPTIADVNFAIEPGDCLAIIGPSAAGKSTLSKILTGIWKPASGTARLDGAEIYSWKRDSFGKYVGYLPQDVELFSGTVKDNIARMDEEAEDAKVIEAAKRANVHELILQLPMDYKTEIGHGGMTLSAGQRQRVALARAYYGGPKVVVLDEPNSSLDNEGDIALLKAISEGKERGITTIIISHRPAILQVVDKILMLKDGKVADFGDKETIIENMRSQGVIEK